MQKTFPLKQPGQADARVVEAVKYEVRKYVKRERRKAVPEGFTQWNFNCRAGADSADATACSLDEIAAVIDRVAGSGKPNVFIEIHARAGHRPSSKGPSSRNVP
jgi:hypothetical protein